MNKTTITELIKRLTELKTLYGDLPVYAVDYHSDFKDTPLTTENLKVQVNTEFTDGIQHVLIFGGSY